MEFKILQRFTPKSFQLATALEVGIVRHKAKAMLILFRVRAIQWKIPPKRRVPAL
jgi:hypothetical protein